MKILILGSKEYPMGSNKGDDPIPSGGMEIYVENLVKKLENYSDFKIIIITRKFKKTKTFEIENNIEIYRVPFIKGFYLRNPSFNLMAFFKSLNIKFDIIITNGDIANILGLFLSKIKGKPIIMVCHGKASEQPQYNFIIKFIFKIIEKFTYSYANIVVTHSPHQIKYLAKKYEVIFPGLDRKRLERRNISLKSIKSQYNIKNRKVILFTGRLIKVKGIEYLIKSLVMIKYPYICFIVGDGPDRKYYQELAKKLKVNVIFTGFRRDVENFLSVADVFVMPSVGSESLNYSMLEAAYKKVPIVVTDLKILPENCGIIVPKKNEKAIAEAINSILENEKLRKEITKNAFEYTKKFDWEKTAEKYYKIIKRFEK